MLSRSTFRRRAAHAALAACACFASACGADVDPVRAKAAADVPVAECLATLARDGADAARACRGFLTAPLRAALDTCRDAGGKLTAAPTPDVWAIDVNRDGRDEYTFELDGVVACEGMYSLFSCGSLGCPRELYQEQSGTWSAVAEIYAPSADALELGEHDHDGYRDLLVGCGAVQPCDELWHYAWRDGTYVRTELEARGARVAFEASEHGLRTLRAETAVLATPAAGAAVLDRYDAGTDFAIVGTAVDADYYYVSPCNACTSGFVPKSALPADAPP